MRCPRVADAARPWIKSRPFARILFALGLALADLITPPAKAGEFQGPFVYCDSDSVAAIAKCVGVSAEELLALNDLTWKTLRAGQALRLPRLTPECPDAERVPRFFSPEVQMEREIWRGVRGRKRIALTFDAGGELGAAFELLEALRERDVPATFFVTGQFAKKNRDWICEVARSGYPLHNHSWSHPYFTQLSTEKMREELERTEQLLRELTGKSTLPYWRPPYGDRNGRVLREAAKAGYRSVYWTLDSLDSYGEKKSVEFLVRRVTRPRDTVEEADSFLDGAIVLMHADVAATAQAIGPIVETLRERGFTFVTLQAVLEP